MRERGQERGGVHRAEGRGDLRREESEGLGMELRCRQAEDGRCHREGKGWERR